ncbi:MAG: hypothetical protein JNJ54_16785 [Myxococcaceae bacterium]|nr:hypothetical protein [Myxococcaceae bacterium]
MRRLAHLALVFAVTACQPMQWQGVWTGTATLNDGRMPTTASGTLTITNGAGIPAALMFAFSGTLAGGTKTFSCPPVISSASNTSTTLTLATPSTPCRMTTSPDDGCTYDVVFNSGEFALAPDKLTGSGNGRLSAACPSMGSSSTDFGWTVTASDRR